MEKIKEIIIVGGGSSIKQADLAYLEPLLATKFTILTNYSFKHFRGTFLTFMDKDFYEPAVCKTSEKKKECPDIWEELEKLPLIIGNKLNNGLTSILHPNTILLDCPREELHGKLILTGIFALTIADMFEPEKIFLLGFDWDRRDPKTIPTGKNYNPNSDLDIHYYGKELKHRGSGYMGFYENHDPNNYFKYFDKSKSKIYNVSPNSNINNFKKITYSELYTLLSNQIFNQDELRNYVKEQYS